MDKNSQDFLEVKDAKKIATKDVAGNPNGFLLELVSDLDGFTKHIQGQMYLTVAEPGCVKGFHLHAQADYYVICIKGTIKYIAYKNRNTKQEIEIGENNLKLIHLPKGFPHALVTIGNDSAYVLMYRYPAWDKNTYKTDKDEQLDIDPKDIEAKKAWDLIEKFKQKFSK